jgi:hypothetical protein
MLLHEKSEEHIEDTVVGQTEKLIFKNSKSDNDTQVGHTPSGRIFREVPLVNLFEQSHEPLAQDEGFLQWGRRRAIDQGTFRIHQARERED